MSPGWSLLSHPESTAAQTFCASAARAENEEGEERAAKQRRGEAPYGANNQLRIHCRDRWSASAKNNLQKRTDIEIKVIYLYFSGGLLQICGMQGYLKDKLVRWKYFKSWM